MRWLIKNIIVVGVFILAAGLGYHFLTLRQQEKPVTWEEVGEGTRETVDKTKEIWEIAKDKKDEVIDQIEDGYHKKDSLK